MIGNGLGANLFVGGDQNRQFVYTNSFGEYFYGVRLSLDLFDLIGLSNRYLALKAGGHYNRNFHENILYNDRSSVYDIKRKSYSCDLALSLFNRIRITLMYGYGIVLDDFDNNDKYDFRYRGHEMKIMAVVVKNFLETGFRFDRYDAENSIFGGKDIEIRYTVAITFIIDSFLKIQANYMEKRTEGELNKELDDDIFILMLQYRL
jgi:hypothetical protein